jgi:predicted nuclease with RNAse H fold
MQRPFHTFVGVDLGGGKGRNTAVALLRAKDGALDILEVGTQAPDRAPWYDEALLEYIGKQAGPGTVVAIDAPLTLPACVRCREPVCPGMAACVDPTIVWFRTTGAELLAPAIEERNQIAVIPNGKTIPHGAPPLTRKPQATPYTQRATEVVLHRAQGVLPRETLGQGMGPLTARAAHLVKALRRWGYELNENLLEVYPKATLHHLFGAKVARKYKREADTWETRARVLEALGDTVGFAPGSRLARETCLQNDHCFDAVVCAYTAYLWARDGWKLPAGGDRDVFAADGWIWTPKDER